MVSTSLLYFHQRYVTIGLLED